MLYRALLITAWIGVAGAGQTTFASQPDTALSSVSNDSAPVGETQLSTNNSDTPSAGLVQIGMPASSPQIVEGQADNQPLEKAIKAIVPKVGNWSIDIDGNVSRPVSWSGGATWPVVLMNMANQSALSITLDWVAKHIAVKDMQSIGDAAVSDASRETRLLVAPLVLEQGDSLQDKLVPWGAEVGRTIVWRANKKYVVKAGAILNGTFEEILEQAVGGFSTADPPLSVDIYDNTVLVSGGK